MQEDGYEMSLTLTFSLSKNKDPFVGRQLGISNHKGYLSQHTERDSVISGSDDDLSKPNSIAIRGYFFFFFFFWCMYN